MPLLHGCRGALRGHANAKEGRGVEHQLCKVGGVGVSFFSWLAPLSLYSGSYASFAPFRCMVLSKLSEFAIAS